MIVAPAVRARVVAFLTAVLAAIDALAATLPDATADDLIAVLGPHVLQLSGAAPTRTVGALAGVVVDRLEAALDGPHAGPAAEGRLHAWRLAVDTALPGKPGRCSGRSSQSTSKRCCAPGWSAPRARTSTGWTTRRTR